MRKLDSYAQTKLPCLYAIYDYLCVHLIHISILITIIAQILSLMMAQLLASSSSAFRSITKSKSEWAYSRRTLDMQFC